MSIRYFPEVGEYHKTYLRVHICSRPVDPQFQLITGPSPLMASAP